MLCITSSSSSVLAFYGQICGQRAVFAIRDYRTMLLANSNGECMKLVEEARSIRKRIHSESLTRQLNQRFVSSAIFSRQRSDEPMALSDTA